MESLFISLISVAQAHSAYLQDADVDAGAAKVVENAVAQGPFRGGTSAAGAVHRDLHGIVGERHDAQAAAVGQRYLAGAAGDDVAGPGQVVDGVDFLKDHRAADRRERGPLIPRPAAGEVGLFTTDLDAGEPALFEQLRQLAGAAVRRFGRPPAVRGPSQCCDHESDGVGIPGSFGVHP